MGGTNDPSNLIELTVEQHVEAHKVLWEHHRKWQDELAWKALSGMIGKEEARRLAVSKANKGNKHALGNKNMLGRKWSKETKEKMRIAKLGKPKSEAHKRKMKEAWKTRLPMSEETKQKMASSHKNKTDKDGYKKGHIPWNKGLKGLKYKLKIMKTT